MEAYHPYKDHIRTPRGGLRVTTTPEGAFHRVQQRASCNIRFPPIRRFHAVFRKHNVTKVRVIKTIRGEGRVLRHKEHILRSRHRERVFRVRQRTMPSGGGRRSKGGSASRRATPIASGLIVFFSCR